MQNNVKIVCSNEIKWINLDNGMKMGADRSKREIIIKVEMKMEKVFCDYLLVNQLLYLHFL